MNFAQPLWILTGLVICVFLALISHQLQKKRRTRLEKFAARQLIAQLTSNVSSRKRKYKNFLILAAVFICFVALARPQYGYKWVEIKRKGIDILFALDTSKSMLTEDIKPNRLIRASLAMRDFVNQLDGDRVGLLPFAGSAYLMCPLTLDYDAFDQSLSTVTTDIIPHGGTNIGSVIDKAVETLSNEANHKILIILTDGENLEGNTEKAVTAGAQHGLTIYTVGVGTSDGELIPLSGNGKGFIKDFAGNYVTSKLDETTLIRIAEKSGGLYVPLGASGEGLETIYQKKLALIPKTELAERNHKVPLERFQWPLALALLLLCLELLTRERKTVKSDHLSLVKIILAKLARKGPGPLLLLLICIGATRGYASPGEDAFEQGNYLQASEYYSTQLENNADDPRLNYNFGTSAYKNNMFDDAIEAFSKALASKDIELQKKSYYNMGISHFHKGLDTLPTTPQATALEWTQALKAMDSALTLGPEDTDARDNQKIITKRLEELKKRLKNEEQQKEQNSKDQSGSQKEQQKSGEESQSSNNKDDSDAREEKPAEKGNTSDPDDIQNQQPPSEPDQKSDTELKTKQDQSDAQRQQLGKMTQEEAKRLLDALKNEEGELNFVPYSTKTRVERDW